MTVLARNVSLAAPLFLLVLVGYALGRWSRLPGAIWTWLHRFVFSVALPVLLFRQMTGFAQLPRVDGRLLIAFFGSCLIVFGLGRVIGARVFHLSGDEQALLGMGGVFSNNVMLGVPLAAATIGPSALPIVAMVLVVNSLILWTLATVSIEWSRQRTLSRTALIQMIRSVLGNPIIIGIFSGTAFGLTGWPLPRAVDLPLSWISATAPSLALLALGAGLVAYSVRAGWRISSSICALKLVVQPALVFSLAVLLGLPVLETQVLTLLASLSVGANVYLMAHRFEVLEGPVAAAIILSTALSALSTPVVLTLVGV